MSRNHSLDRRHRRCYPNDSAFPYYRDDGHSLAGDVVRLVEITDDGYLVEGVAAPRSAPGSGIMRELAEEVEETREPPRGVLTGRLGASCLQDRTLHSR